MTVEELEEYLQENIDSDLATQLVVIVEAVLHLEDGPREGIMVSESRFAGATNAAHAIIQTDRP